jgi:SOS response regulatory protein OraA/RecX
MLAEAKELYTSAEARANDTIRQTEELTVCVRVIEEREHTVDELEQKLQEREAMDDLRLERELAGLATHESSLERHEASLAAKQRDFEDTGALVWAHELAADTREFTLETRVVDVADREGLLDEQQMQERAAAQKQLEDLQAVRVGEAQNIWDFLGQAESALVPFGFSPLWFRVSAQEVSAELPLLDSACTKMLELGDVIANRLEAEGRILVEVVAEHVLLCLHSQDPLVFLEPVVQGPVEQF